MNKELIDTLERLTKTFKEFAKDAGDSQEAVIYLQSAIEVQNEILKYLKTYDL